MHCKHTGIQVYLQEYGAFVRGDCYEQDGVFIFKLVKAATQHGTPGEVFRTLHGVVTQVGVWWDDFSGSQYSVMVVGKGGFTYFGYEGWPVESVIHL